MHVPEVISRLDAIFLKLINVTWSNPTMDQVWVSLSHLQRQQWFLYVVLPTLVMILFYIYGWRMIKPLAMTALTVGLADATAYRIVKALIHRPRPFENPEIANWLRVVGEAHGPSFPSNHATNCFAGAVILAWYFPQRSGLIYTFAALVAYSRLALGVHYPSDVVAGVILGSIVGSLIKIFVLNQVRWLDLRKSVSIKEPDSDDWRLRSRRLADD